MSRRWIEIARRQAEKGKARGPVTMNDPRDWAEEAQEEVYDAFWYLDRESRLHLPDQLGEQLHVCLTLARVLFDEIERYREARNE